jgi:hypothetical protein
VEPEVLFPVGPDKELKTSWKVPATSTVSTQLSTEKANGWKLGFGLAAEAG